MEKQRMSRGKVPEEIRWSTLAPNLLAGRHHGGPGGRGAHHGGLDDIERCGGRCCKSATGSPHRKVLLQIIPPP